MSKQRWLLSGYSTEGNPDLMILDYDAQTGETNVEATAYVGANPSFLLEDDGRYFVAYEVHDPKVAAVVAEISVADGQIRIVKQIGVEGAYGLCNLSVHGDSIYGSCWASGHLFCVSKELDCVRWSVQNNDGSGKVPHAHWSVTAPNGLVYCADVGLDCLLAYQPADGKLVGVTPLKEGTAPRQMIYDTDHSRVFVVNESDPSFLALDQETLSVKQTYQLPGVPGKNYPGGACLKNGLLMIPNRGPNTISVFDASQEELKPLSEAPCGGDFPRTVAVSADGKTVLSLNQRGDNVWFFALEDGKLTFKADVALCGASSAVELK